MTDGRALRDLDVLVVRPPRDDDVFVSRLRAQGARVHQYPVMAIEPLDSRQSRALLAQLADFDKVVVVSRHAALRALALLGANLPATNWYAVGAGSAAPLREVGVAVCCPQAEATSEGLLALSGFARVRGQRVLIIRGEGGRDALRAELEARGAAVSLCELYRRVPDARYRNEVNTLLSGGEVRLVVAHSAQVLTHFLAQLDMPARSQLPRIAVLVPSDSAATLAREAGCGEVIRAASALPDAMVAAVNGWYTSDD